MKSLTPFLILFSFFLMSCGEKNTSKTTTQSDNPKKDTSVSQQPKVEIDTTPVFKPIEASFDAKDLILPEGFSYKILFQEKYDSVTRADGKKFPAKGNHDMCQYLPIDESNEHGYLIVSHETKYKDENLGDGGGATVFEIQKSDDQWNVVGDYRHIDFSKVGGTFRNCGGTLTPKGTILSAEETYAYRNEHISLGGRGVQDLSPINGRERYLNYGYMVEFDPISGEVIGKHYAMGRIMHEDAYVMPDRKTVYLTDDFEPGVFFKFIADKKDDYSAGQLYAYKQGENGIGGDWIQLPRDTASLLHIRDTAISRGATIFCRHEWIEGHDGKLYIGETGDDDFDWSKAIQRGGAPANYFADLHKGNNVYGDIHGRILEFDPETNIMRPYVTGGVSGQDSTVIFSNPDCLSKTTINGRTYLVISEDLNGFGFGRMLGDADERRMFYNELYFLPMDIENPTVSDMMLFATGPGGCETSGTYFTPDGTTMFLNVMHPHYSNGTPFNRSATVVVEGFEK